MTDQHEAELLSKLQSWADEGAEEDTGRREYPPAWKPEPGETLVGVLRERRTADTDDGPVGVLELERQDGSRLSVWLSRYVLREEIDRHDPTIGDALAIAYDGKREGKSGREYHAFRVKVESGSKGGAA